MYRKPLAVQWPIWKYAFLVLFLQAIFTFLVWLHKSVLYGKSALSISDVVYGGGPALFALWQWWAWKKANRLFIWAGNLFMSLYLSVLLLGGAVSIWRILLNEVPLGCLMVFLLIAFSGMWVLPWLFPSWAKMLHDFQWKVSGPMLGFAGIAGVVAVSFGMFSARAGEKEYVLWALGILLSLLAIGFAQHAGYISWIYRPWAREEKE